MEKAFLAVLNQPNAAWGQRVDGFPAFSIFNISGAVGHSLEGPEDLFQGRVQINCYGASYKQAREAATAAVAALNGYTGSGFLGIWHDNTRDMERELADSGQLFGINLDFLVTYRQEPVT